MRFLLPMIFLSAGCATPEAPRLLTVEVLESARIACGAPDARLASDRHHLSIVLDGDSPDRPRQTKCLFERLRGQGYWFDQIVIQNARSADS